MAKKTRSGVYRCRGGFAASIDGQTQVVPDGSLVPHQFGYEIMDGREHLFEDIAQVRNVEQATAAPGERRGIRRGRSATTPELDAAADAASADEPAGDTPEA